MMFNTQGRSLRAIATMLTQEPNSPTQIKIRRNVRLGLREPVSKLSPKMASRNPTNGVPTAIKFQQGRGRSLI